MNRKSNFYCNAIESNAISFLVTSVKRDFLGHSFVDWHSFSHWDTDCLFSKWQLDLLFSFSSLSRSICRLVSDLGSIEKSIYISAASFLQKVFEDEG